MGEVQDGAVAPHSGHGSHSNFVWGEIMIFVTATLAGRKSVVSINSIGTAQGL